MKKIEIYDTTLRDGNQSEELNFSAEDKIRICRKLDELGVDFVEGGWPGANPTDDRFFKDVRNYFMKNAKIAAFGSTHHPRHKPEADPNLIAISESGAQVATIFGKTWDMHAKEALRVGLDENLNLIYNSLAFLRPKFEFLFFDCEHFFDGFSSNRDYALAALKKAVEAGADLLVLCDTNGGTLPYQVGEIIEDVLCNLPDAKLGIHAHNDCELAVANSLEAVRRGAVHVQGTVNGYGERCGNANLCSIIPVLELKVPGHYRCLPEGNLEQLTRVSRFVSEVANLKPFDRRPFVGRSAFAHKGGIHISAVARNPRTYEHIAPESVGNERRMVHSGQAGRSLILKTASKYGFELEKDDPFVTGLMEELKKKEAQGFEYAAAEASFELLLHEYLGREVTYFSLIEFRVFNLSIDPDDLQEEKIAKSEATVMIKVGGMIEHTAAKGHGPVNALDQALRKGLEKYYPQLKEMRLLDFKVRVLPPTRSVESGTASNVRVLVESGDKTSTWFTVGVSYNIIQASWQALADSFKYKLFKDEKERLIKALQQG